VTHALRIRPRHVTDIPALAEILARQQAETEYPFEWPLPYPVERFIHRPAELAAWVAELDGRVVGHVALHAVGPEDNAGGELSRLWSTAHGVPVDRLRAIGVLFADRRLAGRGIGSALLQAATQHALADGGAPVLDVVPHHAAPVNLYRSRGWREVGRCRTTWLPDHVDPLHVMILPLDEDAHAPLDEDAPVPARRCG
jgi:GNAT superfamily N-acetyltransferase